METRRQLEDVLSAIGKFLTAHPAPDSYAARNLIDTANRARAHLLRRKSNEALAATVSEKDVG